MARESASERAREKTNERTRERARYMYSVHSSRSPATACSATIRESRVGRSLVASAVSRKLSVLYERLSALSVAIDAGFGGNGSDAE